MDDLFRVVLPIVKQASQVAVRRFRECLPVERKPDGTSVTAADREIEQLLRDRLTSEFPDDEIYGEELGVRAGTSGRRWVIDPINGTALFVRRIPTFQ